MLIKRQVKQEWSIVITSREVHLIKEMLEDVIYTLCF